MTDYVTLPLLNPRGVYDPAVLYDPNDLITYNGVPYFCRVGIINGQPITPGSDPNVWQLLTEPGETGDKGDKGDPGEQGPRGRDGIPGISGAGYRARGPWDPATTYSAEDSVTYTNSAGTYAVVWFAIKDNTNVAPGSDPTVWGAGVKGDTGDVTPAAQAAADAAAGSQAAAHTSELNAADSATAANASKVAAGTSETNAAASATAANASQVAAGTSETNAAASATAANASQGAAHTSETNAANSAAAAAASAASIATPIPVASGGTGSTTAAAARTALGTVAKAGDSFTGNVTVNTNVAGTDASVIIDGPVAKNRGLVYKTNGLNRWQLYAVNTAESGSNVGSNLTLARYDDTGTFIDAPMQVARNTGVVTYSARAVYNGNLAWDAGNFNPANYMPTSGGNFTAQVTVGGGAWIGCFFSARNSASASYAVSAYASNQAGGAYIGRTDNATVPLAVWCFGTTVTGSITTNGTNTTYGTTSDYRLKYDVEDLDGDFAISLIRKGAPKKYKMKGDPDSKINYGFIAHEYQEVQHEAVSGEKDAMQPDPMAEPFDAEGNDIERPLVPRPQSMDYGKPTPILWAALDKALDMIEDLQRVVLVQKGLIEDLQAKVK